jgi:hypothetical protein
MAQNRKDISVATITLAALLIIVIVASRTSRNSRPARIEMSEVNKSAVVEGKASSASPAMTAAGDKAARAVASLQRTDTEALPIPTESRSPKELVAELLEISSMEGPITAEKAEKFKHDIEELIKQGVASVPAIRELLDKKVEYDFADVAGGDEMGYASLRASLIDALKQIGGPGAQEAMVQVLQTSALPSELLELAKNLDQEAPGQYRDQILNAARESLAIAATNPLAANIELGPAFRIIQNYGDANTTAGAAKNEPANFNNAINLANMPEGQGLAALVQMAENPSSASGQTIATEMIAQMAGQNSKAIDALMQMAQNGQISNGTWEKLAPILGGDQYQIANSPAQSANADTTASQNPGLTIINNATTSDQINQRIALIDQFLGLVPSDSAAAASLRNQRNLLNAKLGN